MSFPSLIQRRSSELESGPFWSPLTLTYHSLASAVIAAPSFANSPFYIVAPYTTSGGQVNYARVRGKGQVFAALMRRSVRQYKIKERTAKDLGTEKLSNGRPKARASQ